MFVYIYQNFRRHKLLVIRSIYFFSIWPVCALADDMYLEM